MSTTVDEAVNAGGPATEPDTERLMIFSSDGHATARMPDYRPYLPEHVRPDFDDFCVEYEQHGAKSFDPKLLSWRMDPDVVETWKDDFWDAGRLEGYWDPQRRVSVLESEGVVAEVLFPDFGLPFELVGSMTRRAVAGGRKLTPELIEIRNAAFNRWLADFCGEAPNRYAGMILVSLTDIDAALAEIRWAKEHGLKGVLLPHFPADAPAYSPRYEPVWSLAAELQMPVNIHGSLSSARGGVPEVVPPPDILATGPIFTQELFFSCRQLLTHMVWGGVLERHPGLQVVFTEMHTGWVISAVALMDHTYENSFLRRDVRSSLPLRPSEYFARQCHMGASIFSRAEVAARHDIGVSKIMLGMDYPHHEGTLLAGVSEYLSNTLGAAGVPSDEAQRMLGLNAAELFGMDVAALRKRAAAVGPVAAQVLEAPSSECSHRGDILRPL